MKFIRDLIDQKSHEMELARPTGEPASDFAAEPADEPMVPSELQPAEDDVSTFESAPDFGMHEAEPFDASEIYRVADEEAETHVPDGFEEQDRDLHTAAAETLWSHDDQEFEDDEADEFAQEPAGSDTRDAEKADDLLSELISEDDPVDETLAAEPAPGLAEDHELDLNTFDEDEPEAGFTAEEQPSGVPPLSVVDAVRAARPAAQPVGEPQGKAASHVEVPVPAGGRAAGRAGRAKTRLLGFNTAMGNDADPFSKAAGAGSGYSEFPVGWLVVTDGPGRGAAFTLHNGVAQIGRGEGQTVRLDFGDNSISRENHAAIAYDAEQNAFYIGHGGKANLVRCNNMPVLATQALSAGDSIRIGETTLRFVPLCGSDFQWTGEQKGQTSHAAHG